jgi:hypothetical protein
MARTALIVTDMLNAYEHADADRLVRSVEESVPAMEGLADVCEAADCTL